MILACPSCQARYLISAHLFTAGPRQVRCARCSHGWEADLPKEIDAVGPPPDSNLASPPEAIRPIPPGSNLPVIRRQPMPKFMRIGLMIGVPLLVAVLLLAILSGYKREIVQTWPSFDRVYEAVGIHIYHSGDGLSFVGVRSELRYEGGKMLLDVTGNIHNGSSKIQQILPMTVNALGVDGKTVQSWRIEPPAATVPPNGDIPFRSSIDAPKDAVAEINLSFVETKDDAGE